MGFTLNPFTGEFVPTGGGGGGAASNSFATIQPPNGTSPTAASSTDTLTLASADGTVAMTGNSGTKTVDFSAVTKPNISKTTFIQDDFLDSNGAGVFLVSQTTGDSSIVVAASTFLNVGLRQFSTGSGASNYAFTAINVAADPIVFGGSQYVYETVAKLSQLSNGTDTFWAQWGLFSLTLTPAIGNGVCFRYSHGNNGGMWEAVSASGNIMALADTGVLADTNFHRFTIIVNAAATSVTYYIDGVLVATITTHIMTTAQRAGVQFGLFKTLGTTPCTVIKDAWSLALTYATPR